MFFVARFEVTIAFQVCEPWAQKKVPDPKIDQNMSGLVTSYSSEDECDEYGREKKPPAATAGLPTTSFYLVCFL